MKLQRRWGQKPLHLLLDAAGLPRPFRNPQRGFGLGFVVHERGHVVLEEVRPRMEKLIRVEVDLQAGICEGDI